MKAEHSFIWSSTELTYEMIAWTLTVNRFVSQLTERIRNKQEEAAEYFPTLCLVIRDFHLKLEIDEEPCTPDEYMVRNIFYYLTKN